jgi:hypothetical protein
MVPGARDSSSSTLPPGLPAPPALAVVAALAVTSVGAGTLSGPIVNAILHVARIAGLLGIGLLAALGTPVVQAGVFAGLPDVLVCSVKDPVGALPWNRLTFYLSARLENGSALYKSLTSNPILLTVDTQGIVRATNLEDCNGRRVAQLREDGQAFDFR